MSLHHRLRTAAGSPSDPYWSNTSLLLLGNGTNGEQNNTFIDSSSNAFTITRYGNVTQGSFSPFTIATGSEYSTGVNGGSGYFDGSGDYLRPPSDTALNIGNGNFTIEAWIYVTSSSEPYQHIFKQGSAGGSTNNIFLLNFDTGVPGRIASANSSGVGSVKSGVYLNQWHHVAVVRNGTSTTVYLDGVAGNTETFDPGFTTNQTSTIGYDNGNAPPRYFNGFISNFRILKNTAQYAANFTPSTTPLTAITNTSLLLNFTNASILDSTGKNDLETVGDAQISTATKKFGTGSLKLDGTGDALKVPNSTLFNFGTGDFTIEAWIRFDSISTAWQTLASVWLASSNFGWIIPFKSTEFRLGFGSSGTYAGDISFSWSPSTNTWYHFALSRSGGSVRAFIDGTQVGSTQTVNNNLTSSASLFVGANGDSGPVEVWNGNIDDFRITKGVARYTAAFTPPTRQLPAR